MIAVLATENRARGYAKLAVFFRSGGCNNLPVHITPTDKKMEFLVSVA